jgi:hypothetical protein
VLVADPLDHLERDGGVALWARRLVVMRRLERAGAGLAALGLLARLDEHPLELRLVVAQRLLGLLDRDVAATDERLV